MARGIAAVIFLVSIVFSVMMLSGIGYYSDIGAERDFSSQNEDIQKANESLSGVQYDEERSGSILEGPLAAVIPGVEMVQTLTTVLSNTSGVLQMLFGLPKVVADTIQMFFRIAMFVTIAFFIRGAVQ